MNRLELAISSIKCQRFDKIYPIMKAFHRGTIFEELVLINKITYDKTKNIIEIEYK